MDGGGGIDGERVKQVAHQFEFSHGSKQVKERPVNIGRMHGAGKTMSFLL